METPEEQTNMEKDWEYEEYHIEDIDNCERDGIGWSGVKITKILVYFWYLVLEFLLLDYISTKQSLERYNGKVFQNTMHGEGVYNWTHYGKKNLSATYEGHFYENKIHGYGTMSYCDGSVYTGLYKNDTRWGPGIESQVCLTANAGLWSGNKLIRLAWNPETVIPNLTAMPNGAEFVNKHRVKYVENVNIYKNDLECNLNSERNEQADEKDEESKIIIVNSPVNNSVNRFKEEKRGPITCSIFDKEVFDEAYYKDANVTLVEYENASNKLNDVNNGHEEDKSENILYSWNNSETMLDIMKHCYEHDKQIAKFDLNLIDILSGPRLNMKNPGAYELDCRTLLMASYLGHTATVAELINQKNVHPNVADIFGNTALMYAIFSNKIEIIDFLIEAGAGINDVNDSCCTALTIALICYLAVKLDISIEDVVQMLVPPGKSDVQILVGESNIIDWKLKRDVAIVKPLDSVVVNKNAPPKKVIPERHNQKPIKEQEPKPDQCDVDKSLYNYILEEYSRNIEQIKDHDFSLTANSIFECADLVTEIEYYDDNASLKKNNSKHLHNKKPIKDVGNNVAHVTKDTSEDEEKLKNERLYYIKKVVLHLLMKGANPNSDGPLPSLLIAISANSVDLVRSLLKYGANVHETYSEIQNYTPLEVAISKPLNMFNNSYLCLVVALLKYGAKINKRIHYYELIDIDDSPILGPTLLHVVIAKFAESDLEKQGQIKLLKVFLDYNSDVSAQFKGRSAIDYVMTKNMELLDIFINHPKVDLNIIINDYNQTMIGKVFEKNFFRSLDRSQMFSLIKNLLQYGADPLVSYKYADTNYKNVITYAREQLVNLEALAEAKGYGESKGQDKLSKSKQDGKATSVRNLEELINDYKEALDMISRHARNRHIKWIEVTLLKELAVIVNKFKHRSWHLIIKEHQRQTEATVWLNATRCIEIWHLLKNTNKMYRDKKVLNLLICIVQYYNCRHKLGEKLTAREKESIEHSVNELLSEFLGVSTNSSWKNKYLKPVPQANVNNKKLTAPEKIHIENDVKELLKGFVSESTDLSWKKNYVLPELEVKKEKFDICFECASPLFEGCIQCPKCHMVLFCTMKCFKTNTSRMDCHPCSTELLSQFSSENISNEGQIQE